VCKIDHFIEIVFETAETQSRLRVLSGIIAVVDSWPIAAQSLCGGLSGADESRRRCPGTFFGQPTEAWQNGAE